MFNTFEKNSYTFLPAEVVKAYKKATKLYPLIKAAENSNNIEDWFNTIIKFDDNEFIENNIECVLYEDFPKANFVGHKVL
uniref:Uncharacterized protein n=1 Tax=Panagrolaimus davidi TaxID=227884 RepID=A0A914QVC8_9BILA